MTYTELTLEECIWKLSEVQASAQRGEPLNHAAAAKLKDVYARLALITKILVAAGLIALGVFLLVHSHNTLAPSDAKTPWQLEAK